MSQSIFALLLFVIALAFKGGIALNILTTGNYLFGNQTQYLSNSGYYLVMQQIATWSCTKAQVWQLVTKCGGKLVLLEEVVIVGL